jgi:hypothetical protein
LKKPNHSPFAAHPTLLNELRQLLPDKEATEDDKLSGTPTKTSLLTIVILKNDQSTLTNLSMVCRSGIGGSLSFHDSLSIQQTIVLVALFR